MKGFLTRLLKAIVFVPCILFFVVLMPLACVWWVITGRDIDDTLDWYHEALDRWFFGYG